MIPPFDEQLRIAGVAVALEVVEKPGAGRIRGGVRWKELATKALLFRLAPLGEVEQDRIERGWVDSDRVPAGVEVRRFLFRGDKAPADPTEGVERPSQSVEQCSAPRRAAECGLQLIPICLADRRDRLGGSRLITNERQYRIASAELSRFEEAIDAQRKGEPGERVDPRTHEAMGASLKSEAEELRAQIQRYEDLRDGRIDQRQLESLRDLPTALIEARIAAGLTQKALAERLALQEQQVQRWEASLYSGVGVDRLQEVADALGMQVRETVSYASSH